MSILGNNLLAQYYAQNQFKYIDNPELWIEADSWGPSTWVNRGDGGYDLTCNQNYCGVKDGNKIVASASNSVAYGILRNVLGTGSFTIEVVMRPDSSMTSTQYGGWVATARTNSLSQLNALQLACSRNRSFTISGWNNTGELISDNWDTISWETSQTGYYCAGYNASDNILFKQYNNTILNKNNVTFSCQINKFNVFNNGNFAPQLNAAGMFFYGDIYSLRVYQRALSKAERANNMRHDKARFNF